MAELSNIQRYAISCVLGAYWLGSSAVTFQWVFFVPHSTAMDEQVASGLAMFIVMGWAIPVFVNYALKTIDDSAKNEPTVNSQNRSCVCATELMLPDKLRHHVNAKRNKVQH